MTDETGNVVGRPGPDKRRGPKGKVPASKDGWYTQSNMIRLLKVRYQQIQDGIRSGRPELQPREDRKVNLEAYRAFFAERATRKQRLEDHKERMAESELRAAQLKEQIQQLTLAEKRGELHPTKDCVASLGQICASLSLEWSVIPNRLQSAFPHVPGLQEKATQLVNEMVKRLHDFAKERGCQ